MNEAVVALIAKHFDLSPQAVGLEMRIVRDLGADSLDVVELVMVAEREFNVSIPDEVLPEIKTVGDLAARIQGLRAETGGHVP